MTAKVLVSACLLGQPVRYDGRSLDRSFEILEQWQAEGRIVSICPEVAGRLPVPRPKAEIQGGGGREVWQGDARVVSEHDVDVTDHFLAGARAALELVEELGIQVAVLKERSPSCGSGAIYDGTFSGTLRPGDGVTGTLLKEHGVAVFGESELEAADAAVRALE